MEPSYIELLKKRAKESRVYSPHQMTGLILAEILNDPSHKSLYIKLAKENDTGMLLGLAKSVAERDEVKNKGAYFMRALKSERSKIPGKKKTTA